MEEIWSQTFYDLKEWMLGHESDIAHGINDFGQLREAFKEFVGRDAAHDERKEKP